MSDTLRLKLIQSPTLQCAVKPFFPGSVAVGPGLTVSLVGNTYTFAVSVQMSITLDASGLKLTNDLAAPGNNKVYGTDGSGVKGWKSDPAGGGSGELTQKVQLLTPHENLAVVYATAATFTVTADALTLFDTGVAKRFPSVSLTVNITTSGANGLDTGAEASSTWYHIWAVGKSDGTIAGLVSTSTTAPTMPSGYTYKGYLGAVRNDGSSNFIAFRQLGREVECSSGSLLSSGTATTYTAVSTAAFAPPTARYINLSISLFTTAGTALVIGRYNSFGSGTTSTYGGQQDAGQDNITTNGNTLMYWVPIDYGASQIVYFVAGTNAATSLISRGWRY